MKAVLMRTGSTPVQGAPAYGMLKISVGDDDSVTGILFPGKNHMHSPRSSLHYKEKKKDCSTSIRRSMSETDIVRSVKTFSSRSWTGSRSFPARIPEELEVEEDEEGKKVVVLKKKGLSQVCAEEKKRSGVWPVREVAKERLGFSGGGEGNGRRFGDGGGGGGGGVGGGSELSGGNANQRKIGEYYQEMLKAEPGNPLLLRNYGQYLHEVEGNMVKAEECYQRAILASPGDGEVLSLYGKLIWEADRDGERASFYFDQAVQASPDDCFVLGSYAHFLWNSEDEEDEEETEQMNAIPSPALVAAC